MNTEGNSAVVAREGRRRGREDATLVVGAPREGCSPCLESTKNLEHVRSLKSHLTRLLARVQKVHDEIEHLLDDNEDMAHLCLTRQRMLTQQPESLSGGGSNSIVPALPPLRRMGSNRSGSLVGEDFDDTEDYVNIQLDNQRNEIIQLQLTLTIASLAIALDALIAGIFGMNIPCPLYNMNGIFNYFVGGTTGACILVFFILLGYADGKAAWLLVL